MRLVAQSGSESLPVAGFEGFQKSPVAEDLQLLSNLRLDMAVAGIESAQLRLDGVEISSRENRIGEYQAPTPIITRGTLGTPRPFLITL